jgi:hypothetical protein
LAGIARVGHESASQLSPACRKSDIDEAADSALSQSEHSMRRSQLELAQERHRWNAGKFTHQGGNAARVFARARNRDKYGLHLTGLEILNQIIDRFPVQRPITAFTSCVDAKSFFRREEGSNRR